MIQYSAVLCLMDDAGILYIRDLCAAAEINETSLRNWIRGLSRPRPRSLRRLCDVLQCSEADLMRQQERSNGAAVLVFEAGTEFAHWLAGDDCPECGAALYTNDTLLWCSRLRCPYGVDTLVYATPAQHSARETRADQQLQSHP